jgi:hypothetical protein
MIHDVFLEVKDAVKAKGMPFEFTYGPPQVPAKVGATRLYMCLDDLAGDQLLGPRGQHRNPKLVDVRAVGVLVRIYASSTRAGAQRHNHEALGLQIANMVHVALHDVIKSSKTMFRVNRAGFVPDETTDGWAGRVYDMRLQIDTPVAAVNWVGEAAAEFEFATGATTLEADGPAASTDLPNATTRIEQ